MWLYKITRTFWRRRKQTKTFHQIFFSNRLLFREGISLSLVSLGNLGSSSSLVSHPLHRVCNLHLATAPWLLVQPVPVLRLAEFPTWNLKKCQDYPGLLFFFKSFYATFIWLTWRGTFLPVGILWCFAFGIWSGAAVAPGFWPFSSHASSLPEPRSTPPRTRHRGTQAGEPPQLCQRQEERSETESLCKVTSGIGHWKSHDFGHFWTFWQFLDIFGHSGSFLFFQVLSFAQSNSLHPVILWHTGHWPGNALGLLPQLVVAANMTRLSLSLAGASFLLVGLI